MRLLSAPIRANAATAGAMRLASVPPASTTSTVSSRISRVPSPIAFALAAHAVAMHSIGPFHPRWMPISPAVEFGIIIGTKNGLTRSGPLAR